jgi:hypothetical protein
MRNLVQVRPGDGYEGKHVRNTEKHIAQGETQVNPRHHDIHEFLIVVYVGRWICVIDPDLRRFPTGDQSRLVPEQFDGPEFRSPYLQSVQSLSSAPYPIMAIVATP